MSARIITLALLRIIAIALYCMQLTHAALASLLLPMIYIWDRARFSDAM